MTAVKMQSAKNSHHTELPYVVVSSLGEISEWFTSNCIEAK
jgi:hypothetical protein